MQHLTNFWTNKQEYVLNLDYALDILGLSYPHHLPPPPPLENECFHLLFFYDPTHIFMCLWHFTSTGSKIM